MFIEENAQDDRSLSSEQISSEEYDEVKALRVPNDDRRDFPRRADRAPRREPEREVKFVIVEV